MDSAEAPEAVGGGSGVDGVRLAIDGVGGAVRATDEEEEEEKEEEGGGGGGGGGGGAELIEGVATTGNKSAGAGLAWMCAVGLSVNSR